MSRSLSTQRFLCLAHGPGGPVEQNTLRLQRNSNFSITAHLFYLRRTEVRVALSINSSRFLVPCIGIVHCNPNKQLKHIQIHGIQLQNTQFKNVWQWQHKTQNELSSCDSRLLLQIKLNSKLLWLQYYQYLVQMVKLVPVSLSTVIILPYYQPAVITHSIHQEKRFQLSFDAAQSHHVCSKKL